MKWITDRKRDLALLEAHQDLVDTLGDLNTAVIIGQLPIPGVMALMESAEANIKAALPPALEALEAVLELHTAAPGGAWCRMCETLSDPQDASYPCATRRTIEDKLGEGVGPHQGLGGGWGWGWGRAGGEPVRVLHS